jgi:aquaporin Z
MNLFVFGIFNRGRQVNIKTTYQIMRKYLTEFIGTFFLTLTIGMVVIGGKGDFAPLAIGSVLMVMIFAGSHISGAHYNPAVTLAVLIRGKITLRDAIPYTIVQILGAALASFAVLYFLDAKIPSEAPVVTDTAKPLLAEFIGTFALAYVVLNVGTAKDNAGNGYYGLAIGFTVLAMAYALGDISGAAFNPAVAFCVSVLKLKSWSIFWVYILGCFGGASVAALVFKLCNPDDK